MEVVLANAPVRKRMGAPGNRPLVLSLSKDEGAYAGVVRQAHHERLSGQAHHERGRDQRRVHPEPPTCLTALGAVDMVAQS